MKYSATLLKATDLIEVDLRGEKSISSIFLDFYDGQDRLYSPLVCQINNSALSDFRDIQTGLRCKVDGEILISKDNKALITIDKISLVTDDDEGMKLRAKALFDMFLASKYYERCIDTSGKFKSHTEKLEEVILSLRKRLENTKKAVNILKRKAKRQNRNPMNRNFVNRNSMNRNFANRNNKRIVVKARVDRNNQIKPF